MLFLGYIVSAVPHQHTPRFPLKASQDSGLVCVCEDARGSQWNEGRHYSSPHWGRERQILPLGREFENKLGDKPNQRTRPEH